MNKRRKRIIVMTLILLGVSIGNYCRIEGTENIRAIEFVSIFTIGMLSGLLLREIAQIVKDKWLV